MENPEYPSSWDDYIGQEGTKDLLRAAASSARQRNAPMDHVLIACPDGGMGKGQPLSARVLTPTGWTNMGSLQVGDEVIGSNGTAATITGVFDRGELPVYRVTFSDRSSLVVDGDHLWAVENRDRHKSVRETRWLAKNHLDKRGWGRFRIPMVAPVQHSHVDLPIEPYFLGVLLANGSLTENTPIVTTNDETIIERCRQANPNQDFLEKTAPGYARRWSLPKSQPALRLLGLFGKASGEKFIPEVYLTADLDSRRALLQGLMDCDGGVRVERGQPMYYTSSHALADGIKSLVQSLGGTATGEPIDHPDRPGIEYHIGIRLAENPFSLERKVTLTRAQAPSRTIKEVVQAGREEIRCISVDAEDQLYVTENYIVTHNTALAHLVAMELGSEMFAIAEFMDSGPARRLIDQMNDFDILYIDEIHRMKKATWLHHLMQDGKLTGRNGQLVPAPRITIIGTTTDPYMLDETILSRFQYTPNLKAYTLDEAIGVAEVMVKKIFVDGLRAPEGGCLAAVAAAANHNPRIIKQLLRTVRDLALCEKTPWIEDYGWDLALALEFLGLHLDGLNNLALDYLHVLRRFNGQAGHDTIAGVLGQKAGLVGVERLLLSKGYLERDRTGRILTRAGRERILHDAA